MFKLAVYEFRCIVDVKNFDALARKVLGQILKVNEMIWGLITRFHEIKKYVSRMTTNEENKVMIRTIQGRQGSADITVDAKENVGCTM